MKFAVVTEGKNTATLKIETYKQNGSVRSYSVVGVDTRQRDAGPSECGSTPGRDNGLGSPSKRPDRP